MVVGTCEHNIATYFFSFCLTTKVGLSGETERKRRESHYLEGTTPNCSKVMDRH